MRIVHVLTDPCGGGGAHALALAKAARGRGDDVSFVSPEPLGREFETLLLRALPSRDVGERLRRSEVVHLHGVRAAVLPLRLGRPVVLTTHGLHALRRATGAAAPFARAATRAALWRADAIVCPSEDERRDVAALGGRLSGKTVVIANGVTPAEVPKREERRAARAALGLGESDPVLLFLGGLRHQKDPLLALEAVKRAQRRLPGLRLLVAGDGPLRSEVEAAAGTNVTLLGWREDADVLFAACDALFNTSRWEGQSLSVLEALWRGRPVIACDAPGNAEATGEGGIVVRSRDREQIADAIASLFETPGMLEKLRGRGRARAVREFDESRMAAETLAVYDTAAAAANGKMQLRPPAHAEQIPS